MQLPKSIYVTAGIENMKLEKDLATLLEKFRNEDWGDISKDDAAENELALKTQDGIMGSYTLRGIKVWIIMEAGHEILTILLPEEY